MTIIPNSHANQKTLFPNQAPWMKTLQRPNLPAPPGIAAQANRFPSTPEDLLRHEAALKRLQEAQKALEVEIAPARATQTERQGLLAATVDGFNVMMTSDEWWKEIERLLSLREAVGLRAHAEEWCDFWIERFGREKESYEWCRKWLLERRKTKREEAKAKEKAKNGSEMTGRGGGVNTTRVHKEKWAFDEEYRRNGASAKTFMSQDAR